MKVKLIVLLCSIIVFSAACAGPSEEVDADIQEPPVLKMISRGREYDSALGSYSWTVGKEKKEVDMPWPPVLPEIAVPVEQGQVVWFKLHNIASSPGQARLRLLSEEAMYNKGALDGSEIQTVSLDIRSFDNNEGIINFEYTFPQLNPQHYYRKCLLEMEFVWTEDGKGKNSAVYYAVLQETAGKVLEAVENTVAGFGESSWKGLKEDTAGYFTTDTLQAAENGDSRDRSSLAWVAERSGWEYILWKDSTKSYRRVGEPLLTVTNIGPGTEGPYADAVVEYSVEVTDGSVKQIWHFDEHYGLELEEGQWKIYSFMRNGKPYDQNTGRVGWETSVERKGRLWEIGPFTSVEHGTGLVSPGGAYAAFMGSNFGVMELWTGSIITGEFNRAYSMDTAPNQSHQSWGMLVPLKICDDGRVLFMVHGYINTGQYEGQQGFWILEQDKKAPQPETLAFVAAAKADYYEDLRVTGDDRYVLIQKNGQLYRIDLGDGTHEILREDMPNYLARVYYNEDAGLMGWEKQMGHEVEIVLYDPINKNEVLIKSPLEDMRIDLVDISGDAIAVSLCRPELVEQGEDGDWPVGIENILIYDTEGEVKAEITPPQGLYIGSVMVDAHQNDVYYTAGEIRNQKDLWTGEMTSIYLHSLGLYKKSMLTGENSIICHLDGKVNYYRQQPGQRTFWYDRRIYDQGNEEQKGLIIGNDGSMDPIVSLLVNNHEESIQSIRRGDREYVWKLDRRENTSFIKEIQSGNEDIILEGRFGTYDLRVLDNTVIFTTQPLDGTLPSREYLYILSN